MPEMDGQEALRKIRKQEEVKGILSSRRAKIIMTTTLSDTKNLATAINSLLMSSDQADKKSKTNGRAALTDTDTMKREISNANPDCRR